MHLNYKLLINFKASLLRGFLNVALNQVLLSKIGPVNFGLFNFFVEVANSIRNLLECGLQTSFTNHINKTKLYLQSTSAYLIITLVILFITAIFSIFYSLVIYNPNLSTQSSFILIILISIYAYLKFGVLHGLHSIAEATNRTALFSTITICILLFQILYITRIGDRLVPIEPITFNLIIFFIIGFFLFLFVCFKQNWPTYSGVISSVKHLMRDRKYFRVYVVGGAISSLVEVSTLKMVSAFEIIGIISICRLYANMCGQLGNSTIKVIWTHLSGQDFERKSEENRTFIKRFILMNLSLGIFIINFISLNEYYILTFIDVRNQINFIYFIYLTCYQALISSVVNILNTAYHAQDETKLVNKIQNLFNCLQITGCVVLIFTTNLISIDNAESARIFLLRYNFINTLLSLTLLYQFGLIKYTGKLLKYNILIFSVYTLIFYCSQYKHLEMYFFVLNISNFFNLLCSLYILTRKIN